MRHELAWFVLASCGSAQPPAPKPVVRPVPPPIATTTQGAPTDPDPARRRPEREPDPNGNGSPDRRDAGPGSGGLRAPLTADIVLAKIHTVYLADVKRCYQLEPPAHASDSNRSCLRLVLEVRPDGSVQGRVGATTRALRTCIEARIASWHFPAPGETSTFTVPIGCPEFGP